MKGLYPFTERMVELYDLLEDKRSKDIFWARLRFDIEPNLENEARLFLSMDENLISEEERYFRTNFKKVSEQVKKEGKKLFLYGASMVGRRLATLLLQDGDFYAFCARNHGKYADGVLGKQVYPPEYIFEHPEECYVLISCIDAIDEVYDILMEHHFPKDHIFKYYTLSYVKRRERHQYFDFPELFRKGTAFIDGGCYNGETSGSFAAMCRGNYSKIIAFEPDPKNYQNCKAFFENSGLRWELKPVGLSAKTEVSGFFADGTGGSRIVLECEEEKAGAYNLGVDMEYIEDAATQGVNEIQTVALDDMTEEVEVGFIKLDVEGVELDALHGAEQTIQRDTPFLAICVYHRRGDILSIMDYLHSLVPQYHFWLRHYGGLIGTDTILYAAVPTENKVRSE